VNGEPKLKLREGGHYLRKDGEIVVASTVKGKIFGMGGRCYFMDGELIGPGGSGSHALVKEVSRLTVRRPSKCVPLEEE